MQPRTRSSSAITDKAPFRSSHRLGLPDDAGLAPDAYKELLVRLEKCVAGQLNEPRFVGVALGYANDAVARHALRVIGLALANLYCADHYARASGCASTDLAAAFAIRLRYQLARQLAQMLEAAPYSLQQRSEVGDDSTIYVSRENLCMQLIGAMYESNGIPATFALLDWATSRIDHESWPSEVDYTRYLSSYCLLRFGISPWQRKSVTRSQDAVEYRTILHTPDGNGASACGATRIQAERKAAEQYVQTHLREALLPAAQLPTRDLPWPMADGRLVADETAAAAVAKAYSLSFENCDLFRLATFSDADQPLDALPILVDRRQVLIMVGHAALRILAHSRVAYEYAEHSTSGYRPALQEYISKASLGGLVVMLSDTFQWSDNSSSSQGRRLAIKGRRGDGVSAGLGAYFEAKRDQIVWIDDLLPLRLTEVPSAVDRWVVTSLMRDINSLRHEKTLLIERCQIFGLAMAFESDSINRLGLNYARIKIRLLFGQRQLLEGELPEMEARDPAKIERRLSRELIEVFDAACGVGSARRAADFSGGLPDFGRAFLRHALGVLSGRYEGLTPQRVLARSRDLGALGLHWLRLGALDEYLVWLKSAEALLGQHVLDDHAVSFYGMAGDNDRLGTDPLQGMGQICAEAVEYLEVVEPEAYSEIPASSHFAAVGVLASICRLMAVPRRWTSVKELLIDIAAQLTMYRWSVVERVSASLELSCWQRPGAILEAIGQLLRAIARFAAIRTPGDRVSIEVSEVLDVRLHLREVHATQARDVVQFLEQSRFFVFLKTDLPLELIVTEPMEGTAVFTLRCYCGAVGAARVALATYGSGRPLPVEICGALATRLHDAKNELVASAAATTNATSASSRTDRLRHLLSSSEHLDGALAQLKTAQALFGIDRATKPEEIHLLAYFRSVMTELLTWVPPSVSIVPPDNLQDATFATDPQGLRAAIVNLCKNAVEAMESKGRLAIAWHIDELEQLHVVVEDSGPGLTAGQLERLNAGEMIPTSKPGGSGAGLLSVRLLLDRLGGRAIFRSLGVGAAVELVMPPVEIVLPVTAPDSEAEEMPA